MLPNKINKSTNYKSLHTSPHRSTSTPTLYSSKPVDQQQDNESHRSTMATINLKLSLCHGIIVSVMMTVTLGLFLLVHWGWHISNISHVIACGGTIINRISAAINMLFYRLTGWLSTCGSILTRGVCMTRSLWILTNGDLQFLSIGIEEEMLQNPVVSFTKSVHYIYKKV